MRETGIFKVDHILFRYETRAPAVVMVWSAQHVVLLLLSEVCPEERGELVAGVVTRQISGLEGLRIASVRVAWCWSTVAVRVGFGS